MPIPIPLFRNSSFPNTNTDVCLEGKAPVRSSGFVPPQNILLVYPVFPSMTYWSFSTALKMLGKKSAFPPLGIATVAAMLPDSCHIRLIDMNVQPLTDRDLQWADSVFLSAMIVQQDSFQEVIKRAKAFGLPVVAGGPYPSTAYQELEGVDHFVIGEAETLFNRFWSDFSQGKARRAYARPATEAEYRSLKEYFGENGDIELRDSRPDVNTTPIPRFDLLNRKAYRCMSVQASRGCPIGCEFCDIWRRFGRKPRFKDADHLLKELDELYRLKWRGPVFVVDDNFIGNRRRAKDLLQGIAEWQKEHNYPFQFFTEGTLTVADDDELLAGFQDAGFDMVFIGIETPSAESLAETRKHINTRGCVVQKVEKIQRSGMQVTSGFIVGFDNDPDDIADRMIDFIQELGIPVAMVGLMQALPETDLYDRLCREGRLLRKATGNNTHAFSTNFLTVRPMEKVSADYQKILQAIYPLDLSAYFQRCSNLLRRWKIPKYLHHTSTVGWGELRAFFSYLAMIPFKSYRWHASRFLLQTLFQRPRFFVTAISLGIQGHHFREITRSAFEAFHLEDYFAQKRAAFSRLMTQYRESLTEYCDSKARSREVLLAEYRRLYEETLSEARRKMRKVHKEVRETISVEYEHFARELHEMYQQLVFSISNQSA